MKALFLAGILALTSFLPAFGLAGPVGSPTISHPSNIDNATQKRVIALINWMNKELNFLRGSFINEFTSQSYSASSDRIAEFIVRLEALDFKKVKVTFRDFGKDAKTSFSMSSNSFANTNTVFINTGHKDYDHKAFSPWRKKAKEEGEKKPAPEKKPEPVPSGGN